MKQIKSKLKALKRKVKLWNHPYIPNPFYSPSLAFIETSEDITERVKEALNNYPSGAGDSISAYKLNDVLEVKHQTRAQRNNYQQGLTESMGS